MRILGRLKKLAADAEAEITRARDHAHLRAGMMKLMTLTAMIDAAHGQTPGPQRSTVRSRVTFVTRRLVSDDCQRNVMSALPRRTDIVRSVVLLVRIKLARFARKVQN